MEAILGKAQQRGSLTVAQIRLLRELFRESAQKLSGSPGGLGAEAAAPALPVPATAASSATAASTTAVSSTTTTSFSPTPATNVVEEIKHKANRFLPHTGPTVEFLICYRIQLGTTATSRAELLAEQFKPKIVAHYPNTAKSISGKLDFCELEKPLGIFLFGDSMRLRSAAEIDETTEAKLITESGLPGDPAVHSFVLTNSAHVQFNIHCATVYVPLGEDSGEALMQPGTLGPDHGVGLLEPVSVVLITRQPFYVSLRERLRQLVALKRSEAAEFASEEALKALAQHFPPHVEKPQGHAWVSSFRDRASHEEISELRRLNTQRLAGRAPSIEQSEPSSVFKCLFCGTTADEVFEHTKSSLVCEIVPEHSVPALPFDAVVYDLVRLLVRRKDVSVECLTSEENRISEDQYELLLEKLHADEAHANWHDVSTVAVAHLLRRYLETLPVAVVPSDLFRSMLYASESNMSAWLLSDMEMKSMETGKTIKDWDQHRVALKSMIGLIFAITKRSMAGAIEETRARAAEGHLPSEDLLKVLSDFSRLSRQAASFFVSGLLRPAIEDDIIRQKPWTSLVEMPPEAASSLGFRTCPKRPKPRSKLSEEEAVSAFASNKEYLEVADRIMTYAVNVKTLGRLPSKQRIPLVEDCINFLTQSESLSTRRLGVRKPPAKAVDLLYKILVYRHFHDPYYDVLAVFEAAGPHVVLAALVKFLSGLQFPSKKLISNKACDKLVSLCPQINADTRNKSSTVFASISKSRIGSILRGESFRVPLSRISEPSQKEKSSSELQQHSSDVEELVKLLVEPERAEATDPDQSESTSVKSGEVASEASTATAGQPTTQQQYSRSEDKMSVVPPWPKSKKALSSSGLPTTHKYSASFSIGRANTKRPRFYSIDKQMPPAQNSKQIETGSMTIMLFSLKRTDMELDTKILVRRVFTLLAAICDNPHNGVTVQDLVENFVPILFETVQSRCKVICERLIIDRCDESKAVIACMERLITTLCNQTTKSKGSTVESVDPPVSASASLIGCLPKSAAARKKMRESLVCPAPYRHFDMPYETLFKTLGPDLITIFINAILCEVSIIFTSKSQRLIVDVLESALSLMAPYEWQGLYIPLLPERMREGLMGAPFPFIVGWMPSESVPDIMHGVDLGDNAAPRLIFNLDNGNVTGALRKNYFSYWIQVCDPAMMPPLPTRHFERLISLLRRVRDIRDLTATTHAILEDSDDEKIEFVHQSGRQRIMEIRWAVTCILISLFKNLRQCITEPADSASSGKAMRRSLNHDAFLACFQSKRHPLIKQILRTQSFECFFQDHIISGGGNPFDHWCFIKVESLTHRYVNYKSKPQQGLLFKAKVGTETNSWKLRFFKIERKSQIIEYYDLPKEKEAEILNIMPADKGGGQNNVNEAALADFNKNYDPKKSKSTKKGEFKILDGEHSQVIVPKLDTNFASGFLQMLGLKKFKTPFQFQIRNPSNSSSKSVLTCCALTSDERRKWLLCLKSRIAADSFLDKLRGVYKKRTSHFEDSSTIQLRQQRWEQIYKFYQIDEPDQTGADGDDAV